MSQEQIQAASGPIPDTVELTEILLDAWSMTTIAQRMPGRPPVAPWLRGLNEEEPQTSIAWRAELDVEGFGLSDLSDIEEWFDAHRMLPHEMLSVPAYQARDWILSRWKQLPSNDRPAIGGRPCIVDRGGVQIVNLGDLVERLERKQAESPILNADIILPASFGGIQRGAGLLNAGVPLTGAAAEATPDADVADFERGRYRLLCNGAGNEDPLSAMPPQDRSGLARFALDLPGEGDEVKQLISLVPKRHRPEYGTTRQSLQTHVRLVEKYAGEIASGLSLSNGIFHEALRLAAKWHDRGKNHEIWQRAVGRIPGEDPVGKSGGNMGRIAAGYRHEFGSLREFAAAYRGKIADETFDLAMHMIAVHHGRGRPHFAKGGFDPDARSESEQIALDSLRRFARLQRRYGYWHLAWLENLLRCADAMASAGRDGEL